MPFSKNIILFIPLVVILGTVAFFHFNIQRKIEMKQLGLGSMSQDTRQPQEVQVNNKIKTRYPQDYTIVMLGDSMTEKLGNADELKAYLRKYFPNKTFQILNYGFGSTNILSAQERLEKETVYSRVFDPILNIDFDVILIESFGHNPLSDIPLEEGLQKQNIALDKMVQSIAAENPRAKIVFVATIAPNKEKYAQNQVDLTREKRLEWANERSAYIQNHISYAQTHNIPLINIYQASLNSEGNGKLDYIDSKDFIHPSPNGVFFISENIAKALFDQKIILP